MTLQLFLVTDYLARSVQVHQKDKSMFIYGYEQNSAGQIHLLQISKNHFMPLVQVTAKQEARQICGTVRFGVCKDDIVDKWICCSICFQWYHDGCIGVMQTFQEASYSTVDTRKICLVQ